MAQQDQWQQGPSPTDDGAILRLEAALGRIAAAAGRRQDELRVAELTARAAQHEADLLLQAREERDEARASAREQERERDAAEIQRDAAEARSEAAEARAGAALARSGAAEILANAQALAEERQQEMRELAMRLDGLIAMVRAVVPELDLGTVGEG